MKRARKMQYLTLTGLLVLVLLLVLSVALPTEVEAQGPPEIGPACEASCALELEDALEVCRSLQSCGGCCISNALEFFQCCLDSCRLENGNGTCGF